MRNGEGLGRFDAKVKGRELLLMNNGGGDALVTRRLNPARRANPRGLTQCAYK